MELLLVCPLTVLGFCDADFGGPYHWIETEIGEVAEVPCPFGPNGSVATRACGEAGQWGTPNISACNGMQLQ